ncbi:unnamed protein product [Paramecium octaurelia]|uniref:Uncharacterized protein n=1 Tax=Paramecium octaurelia TaxID=43137 RepID=A0A8S1TSY4_PAROT|nr:unnamed protein product [Paramecium octaurelia]
MKQTGTFFSNDAMSFKVIAKRAFQQYYNGEGLEGSQFWNSREELERTMQDYLGFFDSENEAYDDEY